MARIKKAVSNPAVLLALILRIEVVGGLLPTDVIAKLRLVMQPNKVMKLVSQGPKASG